ncbi:hypothetical protein C8Q78DRAFT_1193260 [Trametes maxima]|nr:hypothetical protein C8Q78DRAFT_1193260 [Trametes maxima]
MHLIWENLIPNLLKLWTGKFKGLDVGTGCYELPKTVWEAIGEATARSGDTVPASFGPRLGNIAQDRSACTADAYSVWTLYLSPVLLRSQFLHQRYYNHFVTLIELLNLCLQFELSKADIQKIRDGFCVWVEQYEKYYYQYSPSRLSTCPVTVHALLHIADGIEATGPVWASWAFPMERFCGRLQPAIKSRLHPWSSIDRRILALIQITQVKLKYRLHDELNLRRIVSDDLVQRGEYQDPDYLTCILMPPRRPLTPEKGFMDKIIGCLATRFDRRPPNIRPFLPSELTQWGKARILNGGDTFHAASLTQHHIGRRDRTYVRYEVYVDKNRHRRKQKEVFELQTFYGRLEYIIMLRFDSATALEALGLDRPTTVLLAAIKPCAITHSHPRLDIHYFTQHGALSLVDLACIQCVVGRVPSLENGGKGWGIVDRSGALARALAIDL